MTQEERAALREIIEILPELRKLLAQGKSKKRKEAKDGGEDQAG